MSIQVALVGVGGYGKIHWDAMQECRDQGLCNLAAVVIRSPDRYAREMSMCQGLGIPVFRTLHDLLEGMAGRLDLVVLAAGIPEHSDQATLTMTAGCHVLCEKPVAGTLTEALTMRETARKTGKSLAIAYQNILSPSIQRLKATTLSGRLGALLRARGLVLSPRDRGYYSRNDWAGRLTVGGKTVLDSPIQNAGAHYLQNMLYVAGPDPGSAAIPAEVCGECYRAKPIQSADTQCLRVSTRNGVEILFLASHAGPQAAEIELEFEYERGKVLWRKGGRTDLYAADGKHEIFDNGSFDLQGAPVRDTLRSVAHGEPPVVTVENSWQHTACVESLFRSSGTIHQIPKGSLDGPEEDSHIRDINTLLTRAHASWSTLGEIGVTWSRAGERVTPDCPES